MKLCTDEYKTTDTLYFMKNQFFGLLKIRRYYKTIMVIMRDCLQVNMYQYDKNVLFVQLWTFIVKQTNNFKCTKMVTFC